MPYEVVSSQRHALVSNFDGALADISLSYFTPREGIVAAPSEDRRYDFLFPSDTKEMGRINPVGNTFYVDSAATGKADGLTRETAYKTLEEALCDPYLYYTCAVLKQIVHLYVYGDDITTHVVPHAERRIGASEMYLSSFHSCLVVHNATFRWDTKNISTFEESPVNQCFIFAEGVIFVDCKFYLTQHDGEDGEPPWTSGYLKNVGIGYFDQVKYDDLYIFNSGQVYLKNCYIEIKQGNGGDAVTSNNGGNTTNIGIMEDSVASSFILDSCTLTLIPGTPGSGKNGTGGNAGDMHSIILWGKKIYNTNIEFNYTPKYSAGDGEDATEDDPYHSGDGGNVNIGTALNIRFDWCNRCTFKSIIDLSGVSAGNGGKAEDEIFEMSSSRPYSGYNKTGQGTPGNILSGRLVLYTLGTITNSSIYADIQHNGCGFEVHCSSVSVDIIDASDSLIYLYNTFKYTAKLNTTQEYYCFTLYVQPFYISIHECSNVTVNVINGKDIELPDGGEIVRLRSRGSSNEYLRTLGGRINIDSTSGHPLIYISGSNNPSSYKPERVYGLYLIMNRYFTVTCGFPCGGVRNARQGIRVIGRDGYPSDSLNYSTNTRNGGDGTAAYTYNGITVPAGVAGKGTSGGQDGDSLSVSANGSSLHDLDITDPDNYKIYFV